MMGTVIIGPGEYIADIIFILLSSIVTFNYRVENTTPDNLQTIAGVSQTSYNMYFHILVVDWCVTFRIRLDTMDCTGTASSWNTHDKCFITIVLR